jgi:hypothetical protein
LRFVLAGAGSALLAGGCGGGSEQTHGEVKRSYAMRIASATFPAKQSISKPALLRVKVLNEASRTVPNVAITVDSFSYVEKYSELAANKRPVWVVEEGPGSIPARPVQSQAVSPPGGGQTAYVNTWALGPLKPKATRTFTWKVVPVKAGTHDIHLTIAAGLAGNARASLARRSSSGGGAVTRSFATRIAPLPPSRHVNPETGRVVEGAFSAIP